MDLKNLSTKQKVAGAIVIAAILGTILYFAFKDKAEDVAEDIEEGGDPSKVSPGLPSGKGSSRIPTAQEAEKINKGKTVTQTGGRPGAVRAADGSASWTRS